MFGIFKKKLPHCDELFVSYLSPWYDDEDRPKVTRPDIYEIAAFEGKPIELEKIQYLTTTCLEETKSMIEDMTKAALNDFSSIHKSSTIDLELLNAVDKYYDRKKISELIKQSKPEDFSNPYLVTVCEFGVLLGQLFREIEGYDWLYSYPYFHSIIVHKDTGLGITVFDWAVKKFSDYGADDGFARKFHAAVSHVNKNSKNL